MPPKLKIKPKHNIMFVPMATFEKNKTMTHQGYFPLGMSAIHCRESFCYRIHENLRDSYDINKLTLSFTVGIVGYRTEKAIPPEGFEWADFIKLLDILVGPIAISIVPQELLDACPATKAGNFTISEEGIVTYGGIHPKVFLWHPSVTSLLCGLVRTAMAVYSTDSVKDVFLGNKQLISMAVASINNKDRDLAKLVVLMLKELFAKNVSTTHLLGSKVHFDTIKHLQEGCVPADKENPVVTWSKIHYLPDYGPNGFKNYARWLKSPTGKLYAKGEKQYEPLDTSG